MTQFYFLEHSIILNTLNNKTADNGCGLSFTMLGYFSEAQKMQLQNFEIEGAHHVELN